MQIVSFSETGLEFAWKVKAYLLEKKKIKKNTQKKTTTHQQFTV